MRRAVAAAAALVVALLLPASSPAMDAHMHDGGSAAPGDPAVSIGYDAYAPPHIDVLAGDAVMWMNDSVRAHTVVAQDGAWNSGRLAPSSGFSHEFDATGSVPYYCTLHPLMRGEVDVHRVLLTAPSEPGAPGRPYTLSGRAAVAAGSTVSIESDSGAGYRPAGEATVAADGTFAADLVPRTSATYRAVVSGETSPPVQLLVLDRRVGVSAGRLGSGIAVKAHVTPASAGAPVALQLRIPQHFGWWPVARAKLDHHSMARFSLRLRHRYPARVVLTLRDGATVLATSRSLAIGPR